MNKKINLQIAIASCKNQFSLIKIVNLFFDIKKEKTVDFFPHL